MHNYISQNFSEDNSVLGKCRKMVFVEDFYSVISEVHDKDLMHAGYRKTYQKVCRHIFISLKSWW